MITTLNDEFESAAPHEILAWGMATFGDGLAVVTSFQPTGIVTLHILSVMLAGGAVNVAPDVLTLDTGLLFPETNALIDTVEGRFKLKVKRIHPQLTLEQQAEQYGDALWKTAPDTCCNLRKTAPLGDALQPYAAWVTGVRRDQSETRKTTPIIRWDEKYQKVKIAPFATWTERMIWAYLHEHELPYNPLHDSGYPSIGCRTCTQPVGEGDDARSGRWASHAKTECGIHTVS